MNIAILGPCERAGAVALVLMLGCIHAWPCLIVLTVSLPTGAYCQEVVIRSETVCSQHSILVRCSVQ